LLNPEIPNEQRGHAQGERLSLFRPRFNRSIQIVSRPAEVTSDAGAVLLREVLEKLGLIEWLDEILADPDNLARLNRSLCVLAGRSLRASSGGQPVEVVLDLDSIVCEVHGHQDGSAYNGQYKVAAYHPSSPCLARPATSWASGCAEDAFGQWLGAVSPTLCSTSRTKAHYRRQAPKTRIEAVDPFANNEANLLLSAIAANLLSALRRLVTDATGATWRLAPMQEQVLKVGAVLVRGGRRLTLTVAESSVAPWSRIIAKIEAFQRVMTPIRSG
jgi:hypothetical protein